MTLASLVERGEVVPDTLVSQVLVPYLKKERMRNPHAPVLLDSYPLVPSQLEMLERGDGLFGRAVLVKAFVLEAADNTSSRRLLADGDHRGGAPGSLARNRESEVHHKYAAVILKGIENQAEAGPTKAAAQAVKMQLGRLTIRQLRHRAFGPRAKLDRGEVQAIEKEIQDTHKVRQQFVIACKRALVERIVEAECARNYITQWLFPAGQRVLRVETDRHKSVDESFDDLEQHYCETQFLVQQHVYMLAAEIDPFSEFGLRTLKLLKLAETEEQSRQEANEVFRHVQAGQDALEINNFAEAVRCHKAAHTVAVGGADNDQRRRTALMDVEISVGLKPPARRWTPERPHGVRVPVDRVLRQKEWRVPIEAAQIAQVLTYTTTASQDMDKLAAARIQAQELERGGDEAMNARDFDACVESYGQALDLKLDTRRFTNPHLDAPLVARIAESFSKAQKAKVVRDTGRSEARRMQELGQCALLGKEFEDAVEYFKGALSVCERDAEDAALAELIRAELEAVDGASNSAKEDREAASLAQQAEEALEQREYIQAVGFAKSGLHLVHDAAVRARLEGASSTCTQALMTQEAAKKHLADGGSALEKQDFATALEEFRSGLALDAQILSDADLVGKLREGQAKAAAGTS